MTGWMSWGSKRSANTARSMVAERHLRVFFENPRGGGVIAIGHWFVSMIAPANFAISSGDRGERAEQNHAEIMNSFAIALYGIPMMRTSALARPYRGMVAR